MHMYTPAPTFTCSPHKHVHIYALHSYMRCTFACIYTYIDSVSKTVGLASQFTTQNCLGYYLKLNLIIKFHAEVAIHLSHLKLRTIYLEYYTIIIATQLL